MSERLKKILVLLLMLATVAAIGYAIYFMFFRPAVEEVAPPAENVNAPVGGLIPSEVGRPVQPVAPEAAPLPTGVARIADGGLTAVTPVAPVPTVGASVSGSGTINYYNRSDGKFYRIQNDGTVQTLSNKVFFDVSKATFDPGGDKAIIEYPDGANVLYDFNRSEQVTLPRHWEDFDFAPAGDQIVAKSLGLDESNRWLVVANPDGSGTRAVQKLGRNADKVIVDWSPNNQMLATSKTGESYGFDSKEVYFIGQNDENFKSMVVEGLDFRPMWSPSGEQMVYSASSNYSDYKPLLWIVDASSDDIGQNRRPLNINTWADKCAFGDAETLYCAVPETLREGAGLQPDVAANTPDELYKIDLRTGLQTRVAVPEGSHTIDKIMLTPDGKNLFFTDQGSGVLNKIQLAE